jgi:Icc-related predicted phosphoesterase
MKVSYCSDLHLEHYLREKDLGLPASLLDNHDKAEVLVLAGDIVDCSAVTHEKVLDFFLRVASSYDHVLCVMGNHEHYFGDFARTAEVMRRAHGHASYGGIKLLDKEGVTVNGMRFFGGTKWTNFDDEDPLAMFSAGRYMNDYRVIANSNTRVSFKTYDAKGNVEFHTRDGKFSAEDSVTEQKKFLAALELDMVEHPDLDYFVITHHSPSFAMCSAEYHGSELNAAYHDNLDDFILDRPRIKRWVHGHTHDKKTLDIGECTVMLNARGYPGEETHQNFAPEITLV